MHYTKKNAKEPIKLCQGAKFGSGATLWTTLSVVEFLYPSNLMYCQICSNWVRSLSNTCNAFLEELKLKH